MLIFWYIYIYISPFFFFIQNIRTYQNSFRKARHPVRLNTLKRKNILKVFLHVILVNSFPLQNVVSIYYAALVNRRKIPFHRHYTPFPYSGESCLSGGLEKIPRTWHAWYQHIYSNNQIDWKFFYLLFQ